MLRKRIVPTLLMKNGNMVKGTDFSNHIYLGNPINIVKIFSGKNIDEIAFLGIDGLIDKDFLQQVADECFMPFSVGGSIRTINHAITAIKCGAEKVILNSIVFENIEIIKSMSERIGTQSVVICIDFKRDRDNYTVYSQNGTKKEDINIFDLVCEVEHLGAGEIVLQSIDRDGTFSGYDLELVDKIRRLVNVPLGISGGAKNSKSLIDGFRAGTDACYAGSMFVFKNNNKKSILINVPERKEIDLESMQTLYNG
jgi:cyclase